MASASALARGISRTVDSLDASGVSKLAMSVSASLSFSGGPWTATALAPSTAATRTAPGSGVELRRPQRLRREGAAPASASMVSSTAAISEASACWSWNVRVWEARTVAARSFSMSFSISSNCEAVAATRSWLVWASASKRGSGSAVAGVWLGDRE